MKVLILGGGIGGHVASNLLTKKLDKKDEITLVDKKSSYEFSPSFLWASMGWREPYQITRNLSLLTKKGIKYINGEVSRINPGERIVKTSAGDLSYDYLLVALGAELAPEAIPGFSTGAQYVYSLEAAMKLREELRRFSGDKILIGVSSLPFKCPAAPYETAFLVDYHFRKRQIRDKLDFDFFTPEPLPMPVAGPKIGNVLKGILEQRGINYHPGIKLASVDAEKRKIAFENGESMDYDLLIAVPPHRAPQAVIDSELTDKAGWIPVDKRTLRTAYDDVYAAGDVTSIKLAKGKMLPKAGVFAHNQAKIIVSNIISQMKGEEERKEWNGEGSCFVESGYGKAAMAKGDFYAEPDPVVNLRFFGVSRAWHWYKILFEKYWLWRWF